jgi:polyhydroxyalkanoate synthesis regulator phasin
MQEKEHAIEDLKEANSKLESQLNQLIQSEKSAREKASKLEFECQHLEEKIRDFTNKVWK